MVGFEWTDDMKMELMRLKSELSHKSIAVIEKGIGVGSFKKVRSEAPVTSKTLEQTIPMRTKTPTNQYKLPLRRQNLAFHKKEERLSSFQKLPKKWRYMTFFCDMIFVLLTFVLAKSILTLVLGEVEIFGDKSNFYLPLLSKQSWNFIYSFLLILFLFALYRFVFKFVMGHTLGENIFYKKADPNVKTLRRF